MLLLDQMRKTDQLYNSLGVGLTKKEWSDEGRGPEFGNFLKPSAGQNMVELDF